MSAEPRLLTVAVVGATGVVGRTMIQVLSERHFPVGELASACLRPIGRIDRQRRWTDSDGREATPDAFEGVDIALFSAGTEVSRRLSPEAAARGATVIDNSNAWRMEPNVPLIVSQVNPDDGEWHEGIVANPNCSTMQLVRCSWQSATPSGSSGWLWTPISPVSGTGAEALAELEMQVRATSPGSRRSRAFTRTDRLQRAARDRRIPRNGYTREEWKS